MIFNFSKIKILRICNIGVNSEESISVKNKYLRSLYKNRRLISCKLYLSSDEFENINVDI